VYATGSEGDRRMEAWYLDTKSTGHWLSTQGGNSGTSQLGITATYEPGV